MGLDLSRKRVGWQALSAGGDAYGARACPLDVDGLARLVRRVPQPTVAVIEPMSGARFVHDELERHGWLDVRMADA